MLRLTVAESAVAEHRRISRGGRSQRSRRSVTDVPRAAGLIGDLAASGIALFGSRLRRGCGATRRTSLRGRAASAGNGSAGRGVADPVLGQTLAGWQQRDGVPRGVTGARAPSGRRWKPRAGSSWPGAAGNDRICRRGPDDEDTGTGRGGLPASWLPLLPELDVAAGHRVVLADDEAVGVVSPALPGHVRVASPSGRPQLDDGAKCAATHARGNLLMRIIPGSRCLPSRDGGASSGWRLGGRRRPRAGRGARRPGRRGAECGGCEHRRRSGAGS